ncbi:hypothetical protein Airi01_002620 [Actinoallomurus iriomotensis]|uniref:Uncharacterized protein n=1 Tax=Actinoallomurus iriomotensis TaxID=478107 RepID=A0A9W6RDN2_9ACTN|nr:hypothetical protein Airi01_002620 [Actinoallomurus iriomotensis]
MVGGILTEPHAAALDAPAPRNMTHLNHADGVVGWLLAGRTPAGRPGALPLGRPSESRPPRAVAIGRLDAGRRMVTVLVGGL